MKPGRKIAVIDMGTNTFHLLIGDEQGNVILKEKVSVKIGQGGISQGIINPLACERAINTLKSFKSTIELYNITEIYATATSAIRSAANGQLLVDDIYKETGIEVKVISGEKEAEYIYYGVRSAVDMGEETSLVVDIGGGSVEFIICNHKKILWKGSFEIGAQRLVDKFHTEDPMPLKNTKLLEEFVESQIQPLIEATNKYKPETLVGSSGTFDTLSEIDNQQHGRIFLPDQEKEYSMDLATYHKLHQEIVRANRKERMQIEGMIPMRVDMIVVACCLINYLLKRLSLTKIRVSTYSLKEGVLDRVLAGVL
ncbi:phosphatase [Cytophagaceae bacterium ABcell3]|nr:phosphatase [Cytophagaceae bacterium ABcell3]